MKEILSSLEQLFLQFNVRRLFYWLFLLGTALVLLLGWETLTGYFFFNRMERSASLLKELYGLAQSGIAQDRDLAPIYQRMVTELSAYRLEPILAPTIPQWVWKFLSGAALGVLVAVSAFSDRAKGTTNWHSLVGGGITLAIVFGLIGAALPTVYNPWVNYIGLPILEVVILLLFVRLVGTQKKTA